MLDTTFIYASTTSNTRVNALKAASVSPLHMYTHTYLMRSRYFQQQDHFQQSAVGVHPGGGGAMVCRRGGYVIVHVGETRLSHQY